MRIWNFTPHAINIIEDCTFSPKLRKYVYTGGEGKYIIKKALASDGILNAKIRTDNKPSDTIDGIPVWDKKITGIDNIPSDVKEDDIIIVSALYATAVAKCSGKDLRMYTVSDPVYIEDTDGNFKIVGCRGICPAF